MEKPKILIVEDEWITSDHLRRLLTRLEYDVVGIAPTGNSALEQLERSHPDLVLADIGLPGEVDGVEVAARAHEDYGIPVIFLTAFSDPESIRRARIPQPYGFLVKPFAEEELHATIEIALQQKALRKRHEHEIFETATLLGRTQEELRAITARLLNIQEQERAQIARDLHDGLGQRIAFLQMSLETLWQKLSPSFRNEHNPEFASILAEFSNVSRELRDVSHQLHPSILDDLGLVAALRMLAETFEQRYLKPTRLLARSLPDQIHRDISLALYRITQEALHNVAKHAGEDATVTIALVGSPGELDLTIRDTGMGMEVRQRLHSPQGLGIVSMAQRAAFHGGTLGIDSVPGQGTSIHVRIPLPVTDEPS